MVRKTRRGGTTCARRKMEVVSEDGCLGWRHALLFSVRLISKYWVFTTLYDLR